MNVSIVSANSFLRMCSRCSAVGAGEPIESEDSTFVNASICVACALVTDSFVASAWLEASDSNSEFFAMAAACCSGVSGVVDAAGALTGFTLVVSGSGMVAVVGNECE